MRKYQKPRFSTQEFIADTCISSYRLCAACEMSGSGYSPGGERCAHNDGFSSGDVYATGIANQGGVWYKCVDYLSSDPNDPRCW